ncbi:MAG: hypothetical protein WC455_12970 [Dehalococcoidia bacterium]|jgi:hypothetical protein
MSEQIRIYMAAGEGEREKGIRQALIGDTRFGKLEIRSDLPVDLQFTQTNSEKTFDTAAELIADLNRPDTLHIELKLAQDFVQSVLNGHLMEQTLSIGKTGQDGCTVILGDIGDIQEAIMDSAQGRGLSKSEISHSIASTYARCKSFRKRSFLNGVPAFHKGDDSGFFDGEDQFKDILELAHDYLCDGSMMGFRPRPADGERELLAASILFHGDGIGPGVLKPVMAEYDLVLVPKGDFARQPCDMKGIGPKRAEMIDKRIVMAYGFRRQT